MRKMPLAFLTLLAVGSACEPLAAPADRDTLTTARARWDATSGPAYSFTISRGCECVLGGRLMTVTVTNGLVASAAYIDSGSSVESALLSYVYTVPDLFDLIQDALDRHAAHLAVSYDPTYGYPTHIEIDYSVTTADDELVMDARNLVFAGAH